MGDMKMKTVSITKWIKEVGISFAVRYTIAMLCMRIADRIFHRWGFYVCAKFNVTQEQWASALVEGVEQWDL